MRIANKDMSRAINNLDEFQGSNVFAEYKYGKYIIFSYGYHFPMYVNMNGKWIGNSDKYSMTTLKHKTQANPGNVDKYLNTRQIQELIDDRITLEDIGL